MTDSTRELEARARERCAALRDELEGRFGWTLLELRVAAHELQRKLVISGQVVSIGARRALRDRLRSLLKEGWQLDLSGCKPLRTGEYRALTQLTPLFRHCSNGDELATELEPSDGPIELLVELEGRQLVRAIDATVGWVRDPLGGAVTAPVLSVPLAPDIVALVRTLEPWLDVPYRLGGTRRSGVDCSGLVQRVFRESLNVIVPRHSTDQLAWAERTVWDEPDAGDLVFVWNDVEAPCHVGIVVGHAEERRVIHASHSRHRVVVDAFADFVRAARQLRSARLTDVVERFRPFVGKSSIELPEVE